MVIALYVHVPFCGQRCAYCHFHIKVLHPGSDARLFYVNYLDALDRELASLAASHGPGPLSSVFLGGGTPSRLGVQGLQQLIASVQRHFRFEEDCEITLEVNPEDAGGDFLFQMKQMGFNRVSLGVQTFFDPSLKAIGRPHDSGDALMALSGSPIFSKGLSIDLILGLPFQTEATLAADLAYIDFLAPEHISLYMLERDLPTPLDKLAARCPLPDEDEQADFYEHVHEHFLAKGYEHYEISSYCLPGFRSKHNLTYWNCGDYLGAGPAAVGRIGQTLYTNLTSLKDWQLAVNSSGRGLERTEQWSPARLRQEQVIQGLRLSEGIAREWVSEAQWDRLQDHLAAGLILDDGQRVRLSERGRLLGNEVFGVFIEEG